jgi:hypothetical protein
MVTKKQVDKSWKEWNDYKKKYFGGTGNGCDDYRDIPDEVLRKNRELEDKARKLQKEYDELQHYVDNDVWKYRIDLKNYYIEKTIYTRPFPDFPLDEYKSDEQVQKFYDSQEELVQEKYFTKERIQELKDYFCKLIQEDENPFYISCVDTDSGYNVTEDMLFNIDNEGMYKTK